MKILFAFLSIFLLTACQTTLNPTAAPPTAAPAAPTSAPAPTTTPIVVSAPTSAPRTPLTPLSTTSLDVKNINQSKQANQVTQTANITTGQNLGLGDIDLSYPDTMLVGESSTVHLRLQPSTQLVSSTKETAKKNIPNSPNFVFKFSGNVDLYPVMNAQVIALGFDVTPTGRVQQVVDTASPANWSWVIKAKEPGKQELALSISIPAVVNGADSELTKNLQDLAMVITVSPQPVSLSNQIMQSIAANSGAIVVALIGLLGTIIGIIVKMRADKKGKG